MNGRNSLLVLSPVAAAVVAVSIWRLRAVSPDPSGIAASPGEIAFEGVIPPDTPLSAVPRPDRNLAEQALVESDAGTTGSGASTPSEIEDVAQWLRRILPDEYGGRSASEIAELTELELHGKDVGDADLARLADLPNLRVLGLRGTKVTDAGLVHLSGLALASLDLRGTGVTAYGLGCLPSSTMEALHLTDTKVAGAELFRLPPMPRLAVLKLNFLEIDDAAIEALCLYPSLRHLELDQTAVTDAGLRRLLALNPGLRRVELRGTPVTKNALAELGKLYPSCEFVEATARAPGGFVMSGQ
jgi:hypothetical protein